MQTTLKKLVLCVAAVTVTGLLSACGGGGGGNSDPTPAARKIQSANMKDVTAATGVGQGFIMSDLNNVAVNGFNLLLASKPAGSYPCANGGTMTLGVSGTRNTFSVANCVVDGLTLISGTFSMDLSQGQSYLFNDLSFRVAGNSAAQTINGQLVVTSSGSGTATSVGRFDISRNGHTDSYSDIRLSNNVLPPHAAKGSFKLNASRLGLSLNVSFDETTNVTTVSADDGTSLAISEVSGGLKLELRNAVGGAVVETRVLTQAEVEALLLGAAQ